MVRGQVPFGFLCFLFDLVNFPPETSGVPSAPLQPLPSDWAAVWFRFPPQRRQGRGAAVRSAPSGEWGLREGLLPSRVGGSGGSFRPACLIPALSRLTPFRPRSRAAAQEVPGGQAED